MKSTAFLPLIALAAWSPVVACGDESFSNADRPTSPSAAVDSGASETAVASDSGGEASVITGAPPGCDGTLLPTADVCVVTEGLGVFVSSTLGAASGEGTRAKPYVSLQQGIDAAKAAKKRVYACAEPYAENLVLADGVSIFGYFDCAAGWTVGTGIRAKVEAKTSIAVKATSLLNPIRVEALEIVAPHGTAQDRSSTGVLAVDVKSLRFVGTKIRAGNAADGANGVDGIQLANAAPAATLNGDNNVKAEYCSGFFCEGVHSGGVGGTNTCVGAAGFVGGTGGHGGYGGHFTRAGGWTTVKPIEVGGDSVPAQTEPWGNGGSPIGAATLGLMGEQGANGASAGVDGLITQDGFKPGDGTAGTNGAPGGGGGGGTGFAPDPLAFQSQGDVYGSSGAGGGAGGCPGLAGTPGEGGGASIGVISWASTLFFENCSVEVGNGGNGGKGTFGSVPTSGGKGGTRDAATSVYCVGADGLGGGHAGWSGHGAGGPSIGVAYGGTKPELGGMSPTVGSGGTGQAQISGTYGSLTKTIPSTKAGRNLPVFNIP